MPNKPERFFWTNRKRLIPLVFAWAGMTLLVSVAWFCIKMASFYGRIPYIGPLMLGWAALFCLVGTVIYFMLYLVQGGSLTELKVVNRNLKVPDIHKPKANRKYIYIAITSIVVGMGLWIWSALDYSSNRNFEVLQTGTNMLIIFEAMTFVSLFVWPFTGMPKKSKEEDPLGIL